jgi:hypothetical protein
VSCEKTEADLGRVVLAILIFVTLNVQGDAHVNFSIGHFLLLISEN